MYIKINVKPRAVEVVNYILGQNVRLLSENKDTAGMLKISAKDIALMEQFRMRLINGFLKPEKS
ncbi:MAG: hypothetical protein LBT04_09975 [Prevotellaceae bacterium]|jgi:hypothetical protein|nr:hypothetical protein [Prevotellaceae bacterium]